MRRKEFVLLFDIADGNPNGDPDADNHPRVDAETGQGLITDGCLKRKVRNYVDQTRSRQKGFAIYVKSGAILNQLHNEAYRENELELGSGNESVEKAQSWMCRNYFDVRTFGAVMSTGKSENDKVANCGRVTGPVQFSFARSIDPISVSHHSITRCAVTSEGESKKQGGRNQTMGRKYTVPYGLYSLNGFINAHLAKQTGFSAADEDLLWEALVTMFEFDRSAGRGLMSAQRLIVFEHETALGNAPAHKLFGLVKVEKCAEVSRSFNDYAVTVGDAPAGISVIEKI
jgi:CRISPR-associated protein Csd2